jgi:predicted nucleic acid-binding protein
VLYLDTSLVVSVLTDETASADTQSWLVAQDVKRLLISEWTVTEVSSALGIKMRTGQIEVVERASALAVFHGLMADSFTIANVTGAHFRMAALFLDRHDLGLRAGDALHMAVAADWGAEICTLDQRLAAAGPALGVPSTLLLQSR